MTVLALDIGNTRVKWWVRGHTYAASQDQFHSVFPASIAATLERIMICSVASDHSTQAVIDTVAKSLPAVPMTFFESGLKLKKFTNTYAQPAQLGPDRWAACIGARHYCPAGALLVASFGTATTLDVLSEDNRFLGGVILPGLDLMARALSQGTARLPRVDVEAGSTPIPNDTHSAITEGILRAQLGALELSRLETERALGAPVSVLATGGALIYLQPRLPAQVQIVEHLVLRGLVSVAAELE
jgi:type III pantothenate kinase